MFTEWSEWSPQAFREFEGLSPGRYTFEVRGRDVFGNIGEPVLYNFRILHPWYESAYAVVVYFLSGFFLVYLIGKWRLRHMEDRNRRLEEIIGQRTQEALDHYQKIQEVRLEADQLRTANRMAATISHEFNNPLAIIQGVMDLIKLEIDLTEKQLDLVNRASKQVWKMHSLVNKLLHIQRLKEVDYAAGMKILDIHSPYTNGFGTGDETIPPDDAPMDPDNAGTNG